MYYTVKLSNSVNAKMFNLRGKDSLLGGRKVVEFSLTFTTVGDYAAQGVLNTAALGDSATERSVEELINRSTNHYRMPNILMDVPGENIQDQDIVTGLRFTMTPNEENKYIS